MQGKVEGGRVEAEGGGSELASQSRDVCPGMALHLRELNLEYQPSYT